MSNKRIAKQIFADALEASLPMKFIADYCKLDENTLSVGDDSYDLNNYKNFYIFGSGKAAFTMAREMEKLLDSRIKGGLIVVPKIEQTLKYIEVCEGSHPLPSEKSINSASKLLKMMQVCDKDDLYIYLLSGGSSALIELPVTPISLKDFQDATQLMLHNGLEIQEINTVRKHISSIKGGRLAESTMAQGIVLVLSDIIDNDLYSIGSAPLYADKSTYKNAKKILESKNIFYLMPISIQNVLEKGLSGDIEETPKFEKENLKHYIVASNTQALNAAVKSSEQNEFSVKVINEPMQGDVNEMITKILDIVEKSAEKCILFGGECTVKVLGTGQGGRNQHAVALMLREICKRELNICFLSASTDGIDGNSDAAGAVVDQADCKNSYIQELNKYIDNFDSYNLFKQMGNLVLTGPSGTNVIDIAIIIKGE